MPILDFNRRIDTSRQQRTDNYCYHKVILKCIFTSDYNYSFIRPNLYRNVGYFVVVYHFYNPVLIAFLLRRKLPVHNVSIYAFDISDNWLVPAKLPND